MRAIRNLGLLALAIGGALVFWYILDDRPLRFGANASPSEVGITRIVFGYLVTVVGVFLGSGFRELRRKREKGHNTISPIPFLKGIFHLTDFWMGLCASPIVYALLVSNFGGGGPAGLTVIALENGFCCTLIASQMLAGHTAMPSDLSEPPATPGSATRD